MKQTKKLLTGITISAILLGNIPLQPVYANSITATASQDAIYLNDTHISVSGYNINGNNYFKLRDLAEAFQNTTSCFDVVWNTNTKEVEVITNQPYSSSSASDSQSPFSAEAISSDAKLTIDGKAYTVTTYNINGNNYYKLRDLSDVLNFDVVWKTEQNNTASGIFLYTTSEHQNTSTASNNGKANYLSASSSTSRWASVVNTYMQNNGDGTFFVLDASDPQDHNIYIDTYDSKTFALLNSQKIAYELEKFGGFFAGDTYYYMVFGQSNTEENDSKEVYRIVKYDKSFQKIDSCSITGGESYTTIPFDAGSLRMAESGNELTVHTTRQRYTTPDGLNHQSQLTIILDTDTMQVKNDLGEFQSNHVSHSFNQFAQYDNGTLVLVDHGDAYPRSVVLNQKSGSNFSETDLLEIPGAIGANCTGVTVGGFEISDNNYLVAINSIDHTKVTNYDSYNMEGLETDERDIKLLVCDKTSKQVQEMTFTDYIDQNKLGSTPYLVKVNDDRFVLMWEEFIYTGNNAQHNGVKYVEIDGDGNALSSVQHNQNISLTSCPPIIIDNQIIWYYNATQGRMFYTIDLT